MKNNDPAGEPLHAGSHMCPRCGYDVSGSIRIEVPLATCAECGLGFDWRVVSDPSESLPPWFIEHPENYRRLRFLRTWLRALATWRLFGPALVRIEHPPRPRSSLRFAGLCLIIGLAMMMVLAEAGVQLWYQWGRPSPPSQRWTFQNRARLAPAAPMAATFDVFTFAWPFGWRTMQQFQHRTNVGFSIGSWSLLPGREWRQAQLPLWMSLITSAFVPLTFLILRTSRRVAKVRSLHIIRAWCYSLAWLPLIAIPFGLGAAALSIIEANMYGFGNMPRGLAPHIEAVAHGAWLWVPAVLVWIAIYWSVAAGRYMRLRHAPAVGIAMTLVASLAAMALLVVVPSTHAWVEVGDFLERIL